MVVTRPRRLRRTWIRRLQRPAVDWSSTAFNKTIVDWRAELSCKERWALVGFDSCAITVRQRHLQCYVGLVGMSDANITRLGDLTGATPWTLQLGLPALLSVCLCHRDGCL